MTNNQFRSELNKWRQTIVIAMNKHTAYRLNFFLQILVPVLVFYLVKYSLWDTIYTKPNQVIAGLDRQHMMNYHFWIFITSIIACGSNAFDLSQDIRLGKISAYLIYPFNFWQFHCANFLGFQIIQMIIALITIVLTWILTSFIQLDLMTLFWGVGYCMLASFFWFALQYMTGLIAFWLDETWILRVMVGIIVSFLSGQFFPLSLYPSFITDILWLTPFPYLAHVPAMFFIEPDYLLLVKGSGVLIFWLLIIVFCNHRIWKKGLNMYTGAGM
jgi:ABC-2 type transport system permease protein